jgi:hypothetical protein
MVECKPLHSGLPFPEGQPAQKSKRFRAFMAVNKLKDLVIKYTPDWVSKFSPF